MALSTDYVRAWRRSNPERNREQQKVGGAAYHANRKAARLGCEGRLTSKDVRQVLAAGVCAWCGSPDLPLQIDHVVPLSAGGPNRTDNLVASCDPCNKSKFVGEAPRRWSQVVDQCVRCGGTDRPHNGRGLCVPCWFVCWRAGTLEDFPVLMAWNERATVG